MVQSTSLKCWERGRPRPHPFRCNFLYVDNSSRFALNADEDVRAPSGGVLSDVFILDADIATLKRTCFVSVDLDCDRAPVKHLRYFAKILIAFAQTFEKQIAQALDGGQLTSEIFHSFQ